MCACFKTFKCPTELSPPQKIHFILVANPIFKLLERFQSSSYLQKTLDVLEEVKAAVTAVVLEGNFAVRALHLIGTKVSRGTTTHLPFGLQITEGQTRVCSHPLTSTHVLLLADRIQVSYLLS